MKMKLDWRGNELNLAVENATAKGLYAIALAIEEEAKGNVQANGQVDTGFLLNSIYANGEGGSPAPWVNGEFFGKESKRNHVKWAEDIVPPSQRLEALVHASAEYALYQEVDRPFLYPAVDTVRPQVPSILKAAANEEGLNG